jgi:NO-binding membrane sensor protein with MHYT domain
MPVTYEPWLVALSIVIAIQGAYVGLTLTAQVGDALGVRRRLLIAGAAFSLAIAIWAMHFVGMLAVRLPFPVNYLVFPTLLSFLVCVIVVGGAVFATSSGLLTELRLTLSSCLMGGGIFTMHYIGMSALDDSALMVHGRVFVVASMAIAIGASGLALWLAKDRGGRPPLIISATVFGIAISGLHYTAMAGVTLYPLDSKLPAGPALSTDLLAIIVAIVAFCVSGAFLLILVPDHRKAAGRPILSRLPHSLGFRSLSPHLFRQLRLSSRSPVPSRTSSAAPSLRHRRGSLGICPSNATVRPISSPSTTSWLSTPTPIIPTSSTAPRNCSALWRLVMWRHDSTSAGSCAFTAAISSTSTESSGIGGRAIMNSWS